MHSGFYETYCPTTGAKVRGELLEVMQDRLPRDAIQLHDEAVPHAARQGVRHGGALLRQAGDRLQDLVRGRVQHHVLAGKALAQSVSRSPMSFTIYTFYLMRKFVKFVGT